MDQHMCSLSLDKYYEQKMGEGAQKTVSCTKAWACFMKNISLIIVFFFSQTNLVVKFNFRHNLFTLLPFDILRILEFIQCF